MKREFIVERQGRAFCLYAGLLDLAHGQGLKSIRTELIQIPSEANNRVAIAVATVLLDRDGSERIFQGIGDAAPNNVAPAMQTCLIRMAETRAKARALRDAVNIGVAAFEELGEEGAHDGAPERGYATSPGRTARAAALRSQSQSSPNMARTASVPADRPAGVTASAAGDARGAAPNSITEDQTHAVRSLCRRLHLDPDVLAMERCGAENLTRVTQAQAGDLIKSLSAQTNGRTPVAV